MSVIATNLGQTLVSKVDFMVGETVETRNGGTVASADGVLGALQQPVMMSQAT